MHTDRYTSPAKRSNPVKGRDEDLSETIELAAAAGPSLNYGTPFALLLH